VGRVEAHRSRLAAGTFPLGGGKGRIRRRTRPIGIGGGTVGAFLRNIGIDSVVWSRLDESAHQPNEYTLIENIVGDAKVMAKLI
jgi:acetylornithine deacetylase/succinyl-diaminopimelate desuccinylase-like protein